MTLTTTLRVLEFIEIGAHLNKDIEFSKMALTNALVKMFYLTIFGFILLTVYGVFGLKMLKGTFFYCSSPLAGLVEEMEIKNKWDCMDYGGSWINKILSFDTIMESIGILFVTATTDGWLLIVIFLF